MSSTLCSCMHCWLDGWLARLVLYCMNFELWPRPGYTFTLWCMQGNQALTVDYKLSFFLFHILYEYSQMKKTVQLQSPWHLPSYELGVGRLELNNQTWGNVSSIACKEHSVELTVHCTTHAGWLGNYEVFHHSSSPFHSSIPPFHSTIPFHRM